MKKPTRRLRFAILFDYPEYLEDRTKEWVDSVIKSAHTDLPLSFAGTPIPDSYVNLVIIQEERRINILDGLLDVLSCLWEYTISWGQTIFRFKK